MDKSGSGEARSTDEAADAEENPLRTILQQVREAGEGRRVSVQDVLESLGRASITPMLLVPALLVVSPLSGVPGLSSLFGIVIALVSVQLVFGREHLWLPRWILRQKADRNRFRNAVDWLRRPVGVIDRLTRPRFNALTHRPAAIFPETVCLACGLAMPFLELVPFSSSILGVAVTLLAMGLVTRDGLLVLFGFVFVVGAGSVIGYFVMTGLEAM